MKELNINTCFDQFEEELNIIRLKQRSSYEPGHQNQGL